MSAAGVLQGPGRLVEARIEHGDEGCRIRNLLQHIVKILDDFRGSAQLTGAQAQSHGQRRHQKSGCNALAGDVGDRNINHIVGYLEEVIVVPAQQPRVLS